MMFSNQYRVVNGMIVYSLLQDRRKGLLVPSYSDIPHFFIMFLPFIRFLMISIISYIFIGVPAFLPHTTWFVCLQDPSKAAVRTQMYATERSYLYLITLETSQKDWLPSLGTCNYSWLCICTRLHIYFLFPLVIGHWVPRSAACPPPKCSHGGRICQCRHRPSSMTRSMGCWCQLKPHTGIQ